MQPAGKGRGGAMERLAHSRELGRQRWTEDIEATMVAPPHKAKLRCPGRGRAGHMLLKRKYDITQIPLQNGGHVPLRQQHASLPALSAVASRSAVQDLRRR